MNLNLHNGSLMHIISNNTFINNNRENSYFGNNSTNVVHNYEKFNFTNDTLILSRNKDKLCPEYIILNLINEDTSLDTIFTYLSNVYISYEVGEQKIIDFPLNLLWNLNKPEIIDNKIYICIPFKEFFGYIFLNSLHYHEAVFKVVNFNNLSNYVNNYSLLCKTVIYCDRTRIYDPSDNQIQQISSLQVNVCSLDTENKSNEFVINTGLFQGFIKGFFIESPNIDELNEIQFFINGHARTNYDRFLIRNKCTKLNNSMLFYSFNGISYENNNYNSFHGSLHLNNQISSKLRLNFTTQRNKVKIYALNTNYYKQLKGISSLYMHVDTYHLTQDFNLHPLLSVKQLISNPEPISFELNVTINN